MYAYDSAYETEPTAGASYGTPGKSTLTSRLDGGVSGTASAGTPPAPAELLALAGLPLSQGGFMYVLEPDGGFLVIATPEGQEDAAGRKIAPSAPEWAGLSQRMLGAGPSTDPVSDAMKRYRCGMIIAQLMLAEALPVAKLNELRDRVEGLVDDGADHGTLVADLVAKEAAHLRAMLAEPTMTEEQIQWAHRIIPHQPAAAQGDFYEQLQRKSPYANERDNEARWPGSGNKVEKPTGNMCNLTSLAMCLQYLGVPRPLDVAAPEGVDPATLQYEDALFYLWVKLGSPSGNLIYADGWIAICTALGVTGVMQGGLGGKKTEWETRIRDAHLRAGHAVMAGGWGHVVRIQDVTEAGVIVDDPFGGSRRPAASWPDGLNDAAGGAGSDRGSDCAWPWPKDETIALPWYFTVSR